MQERQGTHSSAVAGLRSESEDYESWLEAYNKASTIGEKIGLLHRGFPRRHDWAPAIQFYLSEAEGHSDLNPDYFLTDEEKKERFLRAQALGKLGGERQRVAKKAFDVLVSEIFKDTRGKMDATPSWQPLIEGEGALAAVLHFFRIDEDHRFVNLTHSVAEHKREVVREFLFSLARYGWEPSATRDQYESSWAKNLYVSFRPQFIEVLCGLGRLDYLQNRKDIEERSAIGELELEKLTELAMARELYFSGAIWHSSGSRHFKPETIEQAAYAGSQAAQVAILLRERLKVQKHFREIADAYRRRKAADQELGRLAGEWK